MNVYINFIVTAMACLSEALTVNTYANHLFTAKQSRLRTFLTFAVRYSLIFAVSMVWGSLPLNGIVFLIVNAGILYTSYSCNIGTALFRSAVMTVFLILPEYPTRMILVVYSTTEPSMDAAVSPVSVALFIVSRLVFIILCFLDVRLLKPRKKAEKRYMTKLFAVPATSVLAVVTVVFICFFVHLSNEMQVLISVSLGILLFANAYAISVYSNIETVGGEALSVKLAEQKDEFDAEYYKMLQEQYDRQRILVHDVKNHMQIINNLAAEGKNDEIQKYIGEWGFDKGLQRQVRYCDNGILNIIVNRLAKDCEENGVSLFCDIREQSVSFIDDIDISPLFGNLLSNAFEAAKESEEKIIELDVQFKPTQKMTIVRVMNSCGEPPQKDSEGLLITNKKDREKHGYGQKSIVRIVNKYNGQAENYYDDEQKLFDWVIVLRQK
ncbi:MAG: GHKL domain-containing protein [Oscillospiraceae bacterium]|nr:GHKL domain-containing protein [Oscillospiraceae bacterium]